MSNMQHFPSEEAGIARLLEGRQPLVDERPNAMANG
jgi:hypothetical protein